MTVIQTEFPRVRALLEHRLLVASARAQQIPHDPFVRVLRLGAAALVDWLDRVEAELAKEYVRQCTVRNGVTL